MKMKHRSTFNKLYFTIGILLGLLVFIHGFRSHPEGVEHFYSRMFYPVFSYLSIILFSWLPFSAGDVVYIILLSLLFFYIVKAVKALLKGNRSSCWQYVLKLIVLILSAYIYFVVNWGLNYYRVPLARQLDLKTEKISRTAHLHILEKYIARANSIRDSLPLEKYHKEGVKLDLTTYVRQDTLFAGILSKSQVYIKSPLSSNLVSYFTVTGYFNPFTQEAQVNELIPLPSYPFVVVHELGHQMGIGFEDECNFIAFRLLKDHPNRWYRYAAYYETIQYLFRPLFGDEDLFNHYKSLLSDRVKNDLKQDREFWEGYRGVIDRISGRFYNQYLKYNNQPEGIERYNMMSRLVIAWELQNSKKGD